MNYSVELRANWKAFDVVSAVNFGEKRVFLFVIAVVAVCLSQFFNP